jgi:hypothetical protein
MNLWKGLSKLHVPRSHVRMSVGTSSSANIWTDSWSGFMPVVDFGFVAGCTIEISVLGKGSSEIWFAMSSQTVSNSIPATPAESSQRLGGLTPCVTPNWQCLQGCTYMYTFYTGINATIYFSGAKHEKQIQR